MAADVFDPMEHDVNPDVWKALIRIPGAPEPGRPSAAALAATNPTFV